MERVKYSKKNLKIESKKVNINRDSITKSKMKLKFKEMRCGVEYLDDSIYHNMMGIWDDTDYTLIRGYIKKRKVCHAILSNDEKGIIDPYNGEIIPGFRWYIHWVEVDEEFQMQGIGKQLINYIYKNFACPILFLCPHDSKKFFIKNGAILMSGMDCWFEKESCFMAIVDNDSKDCYEQTHTFFSEGVYELQNKYDICSYINGKTNLITDWMRDVFETDFEVSRNEICNILLCDHE